MTSAGMIERGLFGDFVLGLYFDSSTLVQFESSSRFLVNGKQGFDCLHTRKKTAAKTERKIPFSQSITHQ